VFYPNTFVNPVSRFSDPENRLSGVASMLDCFSPNAEAFAPVPAQTIMPVDAVHREAE
jgi:hypothetical protein